MNKQRAINNNQLLLLDKRKDSAPSSSDRAMTPEKKKKVPRPRQHGCCSPPPPLSPDTDNVVGMTQCCDAAMTLDPDQLSSFLLSFFSVWCGLVFLIHSPSPALSLPNEWNTTQTNRTLPGVCNGTKHEARDSDGTKGSAFINGFLLQFNASRGANSSSTSHQEPKTSNCSRPATYTLEDILRQPVGYSPLICESDPKPHREQEQLQDSDELLNSTVHHQHHHMYLNFDEFRSTRSQENGTGVPTWLVNITHRTELDGTEYNYASASKGAKVVAHNKEAKGANNILGKDHDKYLRNPCSVGAKFVVVELAEETLVDVVRIANFEHYSSNFKEIELSGSLSYPTETWTPLGNFVAENVKHLQNFKLPEPKWLRYLKLSLLSHYGSEFYCTLSVLEVYGIDAIERMLEDLFVASPAKPNSTVSPTRSPEGGSAERVGESKEKRVEASLESTVSVDTKKPADGKTADPVIGVRQQPNGRIPADTVLKILMQKVRSLEMNLSVLEEYIKELNQLQGAILPELDREMSRMSALLEKGRTEIKDITKWKEMMEEGITDLMSWKSFVVSRVDALDRENSILRLKIEKVARVQMNLESKEVAVLAVSLFFFCCAIFKLVSSRPTICSEASPGDKVLQSGRGWILILLSSSMTLCITLFYS